MAGRKRISFDAATATVWRRRRSQTGLGPHRELLLADPAYVACLEKKYEISDAGTQRLPSDAALSWASVLDGDLLHERVRSWHRLSVLAKTFDVQFDSLSNEFKSFVFRFGDGHTSGKVGNICAHRRFALFEDDDVFHAVH